MIYIKFKNCCFFFFEVYFETPKMYTNQLNNICNGDFLFLFEVLPKKCFSDSIFQDFCSDLFRSYLQRDFQNFTNFPENLLVAAPNRFKVPKIFISLEVTAYTQDRRLQSKKA